MSGISKHVIFSFCPCSQHPFALTVRRDAGEFSAALPLRVEGESAFSQCIGLLRAGMVAVQVGVYDASVTETQQERAILREKPFFQGQRQQGDDLHFLDAKSLDPRQERGRGSANFQRATGDDRTV
jgi:hypothetical protein